MESKPRSAIKAVTWRILATIFTVLIVFFFTGEWGISIGVGIFEVVIKFVAYFIHERIWNKVKWGVKE